MLFAFFSVPKVSVSHTFNIASKQTPSIMTPDETTHLLSTSVGDSACLPAELGDFTIKAKKGTKFALWQIGAFGGKMKH